MKLYGFYSEFKQGIYLYIWNEHLFPNFKHNTQVYQEIPLDRMCASRPIRYLNIDIILNQDPYQLCQSSSYIVLSMLLHMQNRYNVIA